MALWVRTVNVDDPPTRRRVVLRLRPRLVVAAVLLLIVVNLLFVEAYANARFTPDQRRGAVGDQRDVPAALLSGGPVVRADAHGGAAHEMPARTIALTFDDGPDPRWTPEVLAVLRRHGVPATFFVIGSQVARHPNLARRMVADRHELGVHTFTHPNLQRIAPWRRKLEYSQTQMAIARAAGVKTALLRFPYSSKPSAVDETNWQLAKDAGELGYLVVLNDTDSQDWARPGVPQIVRNATPAGDSPAVILFHDAGGDRTQTIEALRAFIPAMKARGYRFTTVSEGLNMGITQQAGTEESGTEESGTQESGTRTGTGATP